MDKLRNKDMGYRTSVRDEVHKIAVMLQEADVISATDAEFLKQLASKKIVNPCDMLTVFLERLYERNKPAIDQIDWK